MKIPDVIINNCKFLIIEIIVIIVKNKIIFISYFIISFINKII